MVAKNSGSLGGIVLAGGAGRRIGGRKPTVDVGGVPLAAHATVLLQSACDARVVLVTRPGVALPPRVDAVVVYDAPGPAGPLAGIAAGLAALTTDDALILACDLPLAGPAVRALAGAHAGTAVVAVSASGPQPLCARVPRAAAHAAAVTLLRDGVRSARGLMSVLGATEFSCPTEWLINVNTRADARAAAAALAVRPDSSVTTGTRPALRAPLS